MSTLCDSIIASNNSINENKHNAEKLSKSPSYKIKKILKPIIRILRQKNRSSKKSRPVEKVTNYCSDGDSYCHDEYENDFWSSEINDNYANEELESRILNEIKSCDQNAAIYVYEDDKVELQSVHQNEKFVPVHFARTEAGTFFWTTIQKPVEYAYDERTAYCCSGYHIPHCGDRWVQA